MTCVYQYLGTLLLVAVVLVASTHASVSNGGWKLANNDEYLIARCDIDRVSSITPEEFGAKYYRQKPVILTNIVPQWPAYNKWTREYISKKYGDTEVHITTSEGVHRHYGIMGDTYAKLQEFLDDKVKLNITHKIPASDEALYVFDNGDFLGLHPELLTQDIVDPSFFPMGNGSLHFFLLGKHGSGVAAHWHSETWNALVFGMKRWFLRDSGDIDRTEIHDSQGIVHWLQHAYPRLSGENKPLECVQRRGDLLYIPEHWSHATINIGETVGISKQLNIDRYGMNMIPGARYYKRWDMVMELYHNHLGTPRGSKDLEAWRELATIARVHDKPASLKYYKQILRLDSDNYQSYYDYGKALLQAGKVTKGFPYLLKACSIADSEHAAKVTLDIVHFLLEDETHLPLAVKLIHDPKVSQNLPKTVVDQIMGLAGHEDL